MITLNRPANYTNARTTELAGRSIDTKPLDVENGSKFTEIDTGRAYKFDAENKVWLEYKPTGIASEVKSVNGQTGNVALTAADVGALPITGGTLTGDLTIAPEGRTSILTSTMGSGANIVVKESDNALTVMTFGPSSKSIILTDGTTQDPITIRGVAEPTIDTDAVNKKYVEDNFVSTTGGVINGRVQVDAALGMSVFTEDGDNAGTIDIYPQSADTTDRLKITPSGVGAAIAGHDMYLYGTNVRLKASEESTDAVNIKNVANPVDDNDAVNKKWITDTYGTMDTANATFAFPVVSRVKNVAGVSEDLDAANKYYVDQRVQYAIHTIHSVSIDANGTHSEQVSVQLPTGITSVVYDFYVSVNGQNLTALCSATRTEAVSSSSGSWLRVHCLAYNPSSDAISGDIVIHVLCVHK